MAAIPSSSASMDGVRETRLPPHRYVCRGPRKSPHLPSSSGPLLKVCHLASSFSRLPSRLPLSSHLLLSRGCSSARPQDERAGDSPCLLTGSTDIQSETSICLKKFGAGNEPETQRGRETWCRSPGLMSFTTAPNICAFSPSQLPCYGEGIPRSATMCFSNPTMRNKGMH